MQKEGTSRGVSLVDNASIAVDADHSGDYYAKKRSDVEDYLACDVYEVYQNPTVFVTASGVTVTGVENGQRVVPGTNLTINVSAFSRPSPVTKGLNASRSCVYVRKRQHVAF